MYGALPPQFKIIMNFKKSASKKVSLAIAFALASSCLSIFTFSQKAHAYGYSLPNGLGGMDYYFDDGSTGYSLPNGLGGFDYY